MFNAAPAALGAEAMLAQLTPAQAVYNESVSNMQSRKAAVQGLSPEMPLFGGFGFSCDYFNTKIFVKQTGLPGKPLSIDDLFSMELRLWSVWFVDVLVVFGVNNPATLRVGSFRH